MSILVVSPHRRLAQQRVLFLQLHTARKKRALASGIDNDFRLDRFLNPIGTQQSLHTNRAVAFEQDFCHLSHSVRRRAFVGSVVQQHLVKVTADDLPGLRALTVFVIVEVERCGDLVTVTHKLHAVLLGERRCFKLLDKPQSFQGPIRFGNQRLANMVPRKFGSVQDQCLVAILGNQRTSRSSSRAASDDNHVVTIIKLWVLNGEIRIGINHVSGLSC